MITRADWHFFDVSFDVRTEDCSGEVLKWNIDLILLFIQFLYLYLF